MTYTMTSKTIGLQDHPTDPCHPNDLEGTERIAQAEEVSAGFGVDSVLASDLSCGIGVSETVVY
jgi:hypothetical protein